MLHRFLKKRLCVPRGAAACRKIPSRLVFDATTGRSISTFRELPSPKQHATVDVVLHSDLVEKCGVLKGQTLLLCVSGGLDSMAMLHAMVAVNSKFFDNSLNLHVLNCNHQLRPEASKEANFVREWAENYSIPFHLREWQWKHQHISVSSNSARQWRRKEAVAILKQILDNDNFPSSSARGSIVTAHHNDDQTETMLLKILRGTHVTHLHGMRAKSPCGLFMKPLLSISKEQLLQYVEADSRNLQWCEDATNKTRLYKRNAVRLDAVPILETIAGDSNVLRRNLSKISDQSLQLREWVESASTNFCEKEVDFYMTKIEYSRAEFIVGHGSTFATLAPPVQGEVFCNILKMLDGSELQLSYDKVLRLVELATEVLPEATTRKEVTIRRGWRALRRGSTISIDLRA